MGRAQSAGLSLRGEANAGYPMLTDDDLQKAFNEESKLG